MLVFDATPLIYLAKSELIEKLEAIDQEKVIPEKVYEEVVKEGMEINEPDAERIEKAVQEDIFSVENCKSEVLENERFSEADIQVLTLAEKKDATAVMDEEYSRNIAEVKGIETRGTAYIILKLLKENEISEDRARETVDKMIDEGWYCSTDLYKEIIKKIDEISSQVI